MLTRFTNGLIRFSKGWVALAALTLFVLFALFILPVQTRSVRTSPIPDLTLVYSASDLYGMAEAYGPQGRLDYVHIRLSFDLAWPLVYGFFLATAMGWAFGKAFPPASRWRLATLLPLAGVALDFLENLSTSLVMLRFPAITPVADMLSPVFTFSKWTVLGISLIFLAAGCLTGLRKAARSKASTPNP